MKVTELRIGNILNVDNEKYHPHITINKIPLKVVGMAMSINGHSIQLNTMDVTKQDVSPFVSQLIECIKPIPLTEEWLVKAGFKLYGSIWRKTYGHQTFEFNHSDFGIYLSGTTYYFAHGIKHVHQLQSLYFALTGKELDINNQ